jgi:hypothetical protein
MSIMLLFVVVVLALASLAHAQTPPTLSQDFQCEKQYFTAEFQGSYINLNDGGYGCDEHAAQCKVQTAVRSV